MLHEGTTRTLLYKQDHTTTPSLEYSYTMLHEGTTRTLLYKQDYATTPSLEYSYTMFHEGTTRTLLYKQGSCCSFMKHCVAILKTWCSCIVLFI
jgi:hypothetical protein